MFLFSPYFWLSCAALFACCACAPDPIIIRVDSQIQLPVKDYVYLLLYQKSVVPYANSVLIFDTILLSPKEIAQFVIPPLVVVAGLQYYGGSATERKKAFLLTSLSDLLVFNRSRNYNPAQQLDCQFHF